MYKSRPYEECSVAECRKLKKQMEIVTGSMQVGGHRDSPSIVTFKCALARDLGRIGPTRAS